MARNVVAHYRASAEALPDESRDDISLRWIDAILETDQGRHNWPLTVDRPIEQRVQGCCRDHTLLAIAALRHHGVRARSVVGFASYLSAGSWHHDHEIVEAWLDGRWRRFDPEMSGPLPRLADPSDTPPDHAVRSSRPRTSGLRTGVERSRSRVWASPRISASAATGSSTTT